MLAGTRSSRVSVSRFVRKEISFGKKLHKGGHMKNYQNVFAFCVSGLLFFSISQTGSFARASRDKKVQAKKLARRLEKHNGAVYARPKIEGDKETFDEIWGFMLDERSGEFSETLPLSDIAIFSSTLTVYGELTDVPNTKKISRFRGRTHLMFSCSNRATVHFTLEKKFGLREKLENDLIRAAKKYDGLCIDMEYIPMKDAKNFIDFLRSLKTKLGRTMLSVCVPARTRTIANDLFSYAKIAKIADRVIIMAYDEHWSTSVPGAVASLEWSERVADYAITCIPQKKIIMGLPFYGRTWTNDKHAGAWYFSGINRKLSENDVSKVERDEGGVPHISYKTEVGVTCFFDDTFSLLKKCRAYKERDIGKIAFWRIGQEDVLIWDWLQIAK